MEKCQLVALEEQAMPLESLAAQVRLIQAVMSTLMKEGEHYGKIPGTEKPTLLKPGAEKLCLLFRLGPSYEIIREVRDRDFIAYTIECKLFHIPSSTLIASGIGSCNSRESKYRFRSQNTGKEVPKAYWDKKDPSLLGGPQFSPRKKDGKWVIYEQIENDNPWDLDNTIIKMACKRALVAAVLNATAASDIFTQDLEDFVETEPIHRYSNNTAEQLSEAIKAAGSLEELNQVASKNKDLVKTLDEEQQANLRALLQQKKKQLNQ